MKLSPVCIIADAADMKERLIAINWWLGRSKDQQKTEFERLQVIYRAPRVSNEWLSTVFAECRRAATERANGGHGVDNANPQLVSCVDKQDLLDRYTAESASVKATAKEKNECKAI